MWSFGASMEQYAETPFGINNFPNIETSTPKKHGPLSTCYLLYTSPIQACSTHSPHFECNIALHNDRAANRHK